MSATEKAFGVLKTILLHQERMDGVEEKLKILSERLERLSESHAALRERVRGIEGYLRAATGQPFADAGIPRVQG
jgi:hypothetical protein